MMLEPGPGLELAARRPRPRWSPRLAAFMAAVVLATVVLAGRLFQLQVREGARLDAAGRESRVHRVILEAERGVIYDRHGVPLAVNRPVFSVDLVPASMPPEPARRAAELDRLSDLLGRPGGELRRLVGNAPGQDRPTTIGEDVGPAVAQAIEERLAELPGVSLRRRPVRGYEAALDFAHVVGYTGRIDGEQYQRLRAEGYRPDQMIGKSGIEAGLERTLRGRDGWADVESDARSRAVRTLGERPAVAGAAVYLSLDAGLQRHVAATLRDGVARAAGRAGAAIVMDPRDGQLLALVSEPSFDSDAFARGLDAVAHDRLLRDPGRPLYNRAVTGTYPPGSTFKMITAAAALEEGKIDSATRLGCPPQISYGGWTYRNWARHDMGPMDLRKAIAVSCDTFFYEAADRLGASTLARYARSFGYGAAPRLEIPGPSSGLVPDPEWMARTCGSGPDCRWNPGETLTMGIGQSYLLTTPLIQAVYTSALANGGTLLDPSLVSQVRGPEGERRPAAPPSPRGTVPVSARHLAAVREGMRDCLQAPYGTGFLFRAGEFGHDGGCKTGTAQYGGSGPDLPEHAWFVFFSPFDRPEIAVVVLVEGGGEGHDAAEPLALGIADYYYQHRAEIRAPGPA